MTDIIDFVFALETHPRPCTVSSIEYNFIGRSMDETMQHIGVMLFVA